MAKEVGAQSPVHEIEELKVGDAGVGEGATVLS
jgi:hypothetical protein